MLRAPCRGRTGSLQVESLTRYPLLQRSVVPAGAAEESNPDRPVRSRARYPLRQRRLVLPAGVEPAGDTPWLATSESNRALPPYQSGPFTGWVAASGPSRAEDGGLEPQHLPAPIRFPTGAGTPAGSSSNAEGGALEAHGVTRASLSGRARRACPVHLPCDEGTCPLMHVGGWPASNRRPSAWRADALTC